MSLRALSLRWPEGWANRIVLVIAATLVLISAYRLFALLFLNAPLIAAEEPRRGGVVWKIVPLLLFGVMLRLPALRQRFRLLLTAALLFTLSSATLRFAPLADPRWLLPLHALFILLGSVGMSLTVLALLRGERIDALIFEGPLIFLAAVLPLKLNTPPADPPPEGDRDDSA